MTTIRLGCVKFLNTLPLVEGLAACGDISIHAAVPAKLSGMLERDEVDIALVSLIDAARSGHDLALLPVGMIGCDGPTLTVRLYSQVPLEQVRRVHADTDSHTSTALIQVLLRRMFEASVAIVDFDARERVTPGDQTPESEWPEAMLLIGDKVVTDSPPAVRYPHQLDLGAAWKDLTGLPFVYAVWMCKASRLDDPAIHLGAAILERQRLHNRTRLDWIVDARASDRHWPEDLARQYVGTFLRYDVGDAERVAAARFLAEAAQLGLAPAREIVWADDAAGVIR